MFICRCCRGSGWVEDHNPPSPTGQTFDIWFAVIYRRCDACAGHGIFVSRAAAGLAVAQ